MGNQFTGIKTELYARYVSIEQPQGPKYPLERAGVDVAGQAILALSLFPVWLETYLEWTEGPTGDYPESSDWRKATEWAQRIMSALNLSEETEKAQWMARVNPTWLHFRSIRPWVSVLQVPGVSKALHRAVTQTQQWQVVRGINKLLFISDQARNSVSLRDLSLIRKILRACDEEVLSVEPLVIPLDNRLIAVGNSHLISIYRDCGRKRFEQDRDSIRQTFAETISILFPTSRFKWSDNIGDDDFEQLILTLLARDPQVQ